MKPFLKWAGNKFTIMKRIRELLPEGRRLIEPFAGSVAVFLGTEYTSALLVDSNPDLIGLYRILQEEGEEFIRYCSLLFTSPNNSAEAYYALRREFNHTSDKRRKAALFLYLNRHGYNGLCRYNASGGFNVPVGRYAKPYFPAEEMRGFHAKAKCAQFMVADFSEVMRQAAPGDVVYCDPPYVPLSATASFTGYHKGGFTEEKQNELASLAEALAARGVPVIISNHDTSFTSHAYRKANLTRFSVRRTISSNGKNRGKAAELLAFFEGARIAG
jgi:DNA adenine methylase